MKMFATCFSTAPSDTSRSRAMPRLDRPMAISARLALALREVGEAVRSGGAYGEHGGAERGGHGGTTVRRPRTRRSLRPESARGDERTEVPPSGAGRIGRCHGGPPCCGRSCWRRWRGWPRARSPPAPSRRAPMAIRRAPRSAPAGRPPRRRRPHPHDHDDDADHHDDRHDDPTTTTVPATLPAPVDPPPEDGSTEPTCRDRHDRDPQDRPDQVRSSRASGWRRWTTGPATGRARRCRATVGQRRRRRPPGRATTRTSATSTSSRAGDEVIMSTMTGRHVYHVRQHRGRRARRPLDRRPDPGPHGDAVRLPPARLRRASASSSTSSCRRERPSATRRAARWARALLSLGAGFLVALSLPPWGWWPLAFVGVALFEIALGAGAGPRRPLRPGHGLRRGLAGRWAWAGCGSSPCPATSPPA